MKQEEKILEELRKKAKGLEIPKGLEPDEMREILKEHDRKQYFRRGKLYPALAAAACFCLVGGLVLHMYWQGLVSPPEEMSPKVEQVGIQDSDPAGQETKPESEEQESLKLPVLTYEEIYAKMFAAGAGREEVAATEDLQDSKSISAVAEMKYAASEKEEAFGKTNVQTAGIDEADQIKNDGRYLYQIAGRRPENGEENAKGILENRGIQIIDTQGGLTEAAFIDGFDSIEEFYVWENLLITIENKYYESSWADERNAKKGMAVFEDMAYLGNPYHEIKVFDISDRTGPKEIKTFTLQGSYASSRIADGYFYEISRFAASPGEGEQDYQAYIPTLEGKQMDADRIYCPEGVNGTAYLVLVSIDLGNPSTFKDGRAILSGGDIYYMSEQNLYVADYESVYRRQPEAEGSVADKTKLLRFRYLNGHYYAQAQGEIQGRLDSSLSMDEYRGSLRVVTTVQEYEAKQIRDDRTGEVLGFDYGTPVQTNALYVLDRELSVTGKIEGLARGEQIYSARFLGNTGYFVTFRQTDPLFAVDLSEPEHPRVLGELKVSGFSEYLHFWNEDLLLGIGMEADEETGQRECLKLSMFDISDPAVVKEEARKELTDYNYSEVLCNYKAVLIDTSENLIGFCAEGSNQGEYWKDYLVYAYENGSFVQKLKLETRAEDGGFYRTRGTFIGEVLYLLRENGSVQAYNRESGKLLETL